jgi:hypothetical protein
MVLPNPTNDFFKRLETMIYQFIWGGGNDKIKKSVIIGKINQYDTFTFTFLFAIL